MNSTSAGRFSGIPRPVWHTPTGFKTDLKRHVPDVSYFADSYPGLAFNCAGTAFGVYPTDNGWSTVRGTSAAG